MTDFDEGIPGVAVSPHQAGRAEHRQQARHRRVARRRVPEKIAVPPDFPGPVGHPAQAMIYDITPTGHAAAGRLARRHAAEPRGAAATCTAATTSRFRRCGRRSTSGLTPMRRAITDKDAPSIEARPSGLLPRAVPGGAAWPRNVNERVMIDRAFNRERNGCCWRRAPIPDPRIFNADFAAYDPVFIDRLHDAGRQADRHRYAEHRSVRLEGSAEPSRHPAA